MQAINAPLTGDFAQKPSVFLAGSIDNGATQDWQTNMIESLSELDIVVLNPRRSNWLGGSEPLMSNPVFKEQVNWELDHLERADVVFIYFNKESMSPISLLELGLCARNKEVIVCCEKGFWRRGNVEAVCTAFGIQLFDSLPKSTTFLTNKMSSLI